MKRAVYRNLGAHNRDVILSPGVGLDNGFFDLGGGRVLVVTADPISMVPALGSELSAWLSVNLIASDFSSSGVKPTLATFVYNFPPEVSDAAARTYLEAVGRECSSLGVTIIAGHTGRYPGAGITVIGSGTMMGLGKKGGFVTPAMARAGDRIIMTKQAALETTAYLAWSFPEFLEERTGSRTVSRGKKMIGLCSTVKDALAAARVGLGASGVTSMHDATEGGVLGGLAEIAEASGLRLDVREEKIQVTRVVSEVCNAFGLDPLTSLSEGTLLLTCRPGRVQKLIAELNGEGIPAFEIGSASQGNGLWISRGDGTPRKAGEILDGYWGAYERGWKREREGEGDGRLGRREVLS